MLFAGILGERNKGLTELCKNSLTELSILVVEVDGELRDPTLDLVSFLPLPFFFFL